MKQLVLGFHLLAIVSKSRNNEIRIIFLKGYGAAATEKKLSLIKLQIL